MKGPDYIFCVLFCCISFVLPSSFEAPRKGHMSGLRYGKCGNQEDMESVSHWVAQKWPGVSSVGPARPRRLFSLLPNYLSGVSPLPHLIPGSAWMPVGSVGCGPGLCPLLPCSPIHSLVLYPKYHFPQDQCLDDPGKTRKHIHK